MPDETESAQNPTEPSPSPSEPEALAQAALSSAQAAIDALNTETQSVPRSASAGSAAAPRSTASPKLSPPSVPDFVPTEITSLPKGMDLISDVNVDVTIELGRTRMLVEDVLRLAEGAVVELDKLAGDPVDIYVNKRLVARGEVLVLNDNFCIRVNDILDADVVERGRN